MNLLASLVVSACVTPLAIRLALAAGWIDRWEGNPERKPRRAAIPLVGGFSLAAGLAAGGEEWPWGALLLALLLGSIDDRLPRGLPVGWKLAGQALVALLLALLHPSGSLPGAFGPAETFLLALVAMNAVNTWDNADGAAAGLAWAAGQWGGSAGLAGAALGFLPWNLAPSKGVPRAYLGDGGSHLIGVAIAARPQMAWVLLLPLLDLLRLSILRFLAGDPPWRGDRRHLAHRLQAAGMPPWALALLLALLAGAPLVWGLSGVLLSVVAFALLVLRTPSPCSPPPPSG